MHSPNIVELPEPPTGKNGWPWTEEGPQLPETMPDGLAWPLVSIVTPSYNQGQFIEETIRSVLLQGYPNLEYIIMDGGSSDNSVEIIKKYEPWLAFWVSESDGGQSHSINKGFRKATGEIFAWLNSDDTYQPNALVDAVSHLSNHSETGMVYGHAQLIDSNGKKFSIWRAPEFELQKQIFDYRVIPQQTAFFRQSVFAQVGEIREDMYYAMDFDLWLRIGASFHIDRIDQVLGNLREHDSSKTISDRHGNRTEILQSLQRFFALPGLSPDILSLEAYAYAVLNLHRSLRAYQLNNQGDGKSFLTKTFQLAPDLAGKYRQRILVLLVAYSPHEAGETRAYFQSITESLPENAFPLRRLLELAQNRITIISAAESEDRRLHKKAKSCVKEVIFQDREWLWNSKVIVAIMSLYIGRSRLAYLAKFRENALHALNGNKNSSR